MNTTVESLKIPLYQVWIPDEASDIFSSVIESGQIANGTNVDLFEKALQGYLGNPYVTTTSDISTSLTLSLFMAGVRPGDDVLMSPLVCLATSCPVRNLFANIVWCDIDPLTGNIDPASIRNKITSRSKAIVVYHWAGNPAELAEIYAVAKEHGLIIIEDAGEALGAEYRGLKIGNTGADYTVFSFYPNRHLTTLEGGAIACAREDDYTQLRYLKRYGIHQPSFRLADGEINPDSDIKTAGWNSYLNNLAAGLGLAQLKHLPDRIASYQANGQFYDQMLKGLPAITIFNRPLDSLSAYWVYTFLADDRDYLIKQLNQLGISASKVHIRNDYYSCFTKCQQNLSGVDEFSAKCISIPSGWWVDEVTRADIVKSIRLILD